MLNRNNNTSDKLLTVNTIRCPQNHPCPAVNVCPVEALIQNNFDAPIINQDICIKCGKCVNYCPMQALVFN